MAVGLRRCFGLVAEIGKLADPGQAKDGYAKVGKQLRVPLCKVMFDPQTPTVLYPPPQKKGSVERHLKHRSFLQRAIDL
jgi:hypothetical protein